MYSTYIFGEKNRELAVGFTGIREEKQWLLGGLLGAGCGSIDQMWCTGGGKVIGHKTAQDLNSWLIPRCRLDFL